MDLDQAGLEQHLGLSRSAITRMAAWPLSCGPMTTSHCLSWRQASAPRSGRCSRASSTRARRRTGNSVEVARSEREHVDHRNGSKHPEKGSGVLFMSKPSQRRPLPCLEQKREALAAAKEGEMVRCIARGPSRRQAPHASFAQSPLVPAQPPGPGVRVQIKPHLGQQAGKGAVRPA